MSYKIIPLVQSRIAAPLGVPFYLGDMRTLVTSAVYIWHIAGGDEKIVVDAGMEAPGSNGLVHGFPAMGGGEIGTREALAKVGLKPEEVDTLILTHLHFDHVATVDLFHNARIIVQKKEWEFAHHPTPHMKGTYDQTALSKIENMDLVLVDGDTEIAKGIRVVTLPGHTKGLQGVAVDTEKGAYLLASDHFYTYFNIMPPRENVEFTDLAGTKLSLGPSPLPFLPIGLHVDLSDWFESSYKTLTITKRNMIIPGHEPSVVGKTFP